MDTSDRFGIVRLLDPNNAQFSGQQRVNAEIFTAMEILGRKLERSESERDRLARRLALIESAATVDERTGKLYLPVVMDDRAPPQAAESASSKWVIAASLMSSSIALFALGLVLFREPSMTSGPEQIAAMDTFRTPRFALEMSENGTWKRPGAPAQLPGAAELMRQEKMAEAPKLDAVSPGMPVVAAAPSGPSRTGAGSPPGTQVAETATVDEKAVVEKTQTSILQVADKNVAPPPETKRGAMSLAEMKVRVTPAGSAAVETMQSFPPDRSLPEKLAQLEARAYQGVPEAQHDMATLYASGKLLAQNYPRAIYWFSKAADGGVANANYNLGVIYQQGLGVKRDMQRALGWYEKAAELGHPEAMYNLGIAYAEGIGTPANIEKGVSYFKRAAHAGVAQAAYNLGVLYESTYTGSVDTNKALEWYQVAADAGHAEARAAVNRLNGSVDQGLVLANTVEPAGGGDRDPSLTNDGRAPAPPFNGTILAKVQQELVRQGLLSGKADGVMTPQTEDAIRANQKKLGLKEDGQASQGLLDELIKSSSSSPGG
ncbi:MAG: SEL1-like repeat protein [Proteobacteria bacterium]|nr:SEL1-like repeat protein [Pseudomonadota bacterium]